MLSNVSLHAAFVRVQIRFRVHSLRWLDCQSLSLHIDSADAPVQRNIAFRLSLRRRA
jgi:hypothetical protein